MKWDQASVETYLNNWEVIDTALIPVIKVELGREAAESINRAAWVYGVANQLEEQLAGRVILLPAIPYTHSAEPVINYLVSFAREMTQKASNVIYLTAEQELKEKDASNPLKLLVMDLEEKGSQPPSTQDLFDVAQKYVPLLIRMWQKG